MRAEARAARGEVNPAEVVAATAPPRPSQAELIDQYLEDRERRTAEYLVQEGRRVYLWGVHPVGGVAPDATDTPLYLRTECTGSRAAVLGAQGAAGSGRRTTR